MLRATELAGFIGAGLAGAAYVPQIWHLIRERCSAGLSRVAFATWLLASALVTTHAVAIGASVFIVLGAIQLAATTVIVVYTSKYEHSYCTSHLPRSFEPEPPPSRRPPAGMPADVGLPVVDDARPSIGLGAVKTAAGSSTVDQLAGTP